MKKKDGLLLPDIEEVFAIGDNFFKCVQGDFCVGCAFDGGNEYESYCALVDCMSAERPDGISVVYKENYNDETV